MAFDYTLLCCPKCSGRLEEKELGRLACTSCTRYAVVRDGKVFFVVPPVDAVVNPVVNSIDSSRWTPLRRAQYAFLASYLKKFNAGGRLCDVGSGPGQFSKLYEKFSTVLALDFYPYARVDIITNFEKRLPLRDETFDVVVSMNTFEHIHRVGDLIKECLRICGPGGMLVGSTPFLLGVHQAPYDFYRFTNFELEKILGEAGFIGITVVPLANALDWYRTSQLHFFMGLFDFCRSRPDFFSRFLLTILVKIVWNVQKFLLLVFSPLYKMSRDQINTLGYGFVAFKSE